MPKPPKPVSELDQSKVGLQDDHDPRDPAQKQNDKSKGEFKPPKQPAGPSIATRRAEAKWTRRDCLTTRVSSADSSPFLI